MLIYHDQERQVQAQGCGRHHPWTVSTKDAAFGYTDFKEHPERIAEALIELEPYKGTKLARHIVDFFAWANNKSSPFETNNFDIRPIGANPTPAVCSKPLQIQGQVTFLFRHLELNTDIEHVHAFLREVSDHISGDNPDFWDAVWSWHSWPHLFTELENQGELSLGECMAFTFWAWGNDEQEAQSNAIRAIDSLRTALLSAHEKLCGPSVDA